LHEASRCRCWDGCGVQACGGPAASVFSQPRPVPLRAAGGDRVHGKANLGFTALMAWDALADG